MLIACIGNIFLGDDGFGCKVAELLAQKSLSPEVKVVDFGIRSFDLAYALMDGYETTVFVDATPRGGDPGTVYLIEPDEAEIKALDGQASLFEPHNMDPLKVLMMVRSLDGKLGKIFVVGCEPEFTNADGDGYLGLSDRVEASLPKAVEVVESVIERTLLQRSQPAPV